MNYEVLKNFVKVYVDSRLKAIENDPDYSPMTRCVLGIEMRGIVEAIEDVEEITNQPSAEEISAESKHQLQMISIEVGEDPDIVRDVAEYHGFDVERIGKEDFYDIVGLFA